MRNSSRVDDHRYHEYQKKLANIEIKLNEIASQHEALLLENETLFKKNCSLRDDLEIEENFKFSKSLLINTVVPNRPRQIEESKLAILESYNRFEADCKRLLTENNKLIRENKKFEDWCKRKPNPKNSHFVFFKTLSRTATQITPTKKPTEKLRRGIKKH